MERQYEKENIPLIATIRDADIGIVTSFDGAVKDRRLAARLILKDRNGKIALVYTEKHGHHKLPGGGVEEGEDFALAAAREALEEAGCRSLVHRPAIAAIVEVRGEFAQEQQSVLFMAEVVGDVGTSKLTANEIREGFRPPVWVTINEAIALFKSDRPKTYVGKFMHARDQAFVEYAASIGK